MQKDELRRRFIIDEKELKERLATLVEKASRHCRVDSTGRIHLENKGLSTKHKIMLALTARSIAAELDSTIGADVTIRELAQNVGVPENHVRARCGELVKERYAEASARGVFKAVFARIESFLDSLKSN